MYPVILYGVDIVVKGECHSIRSVVASGDVIVMFSGGSIGTVDEME